MLLPSVWRLTSHLCNGFIIGICCVTNVSAAWDQKAEKKHCFVSATKWQQWRETFPSAAATSRSEFGACSMFLITTLHSLSRIVETQLNYNFHWKQFAFMHVQAIYCSERLSAFLKSLFRTWRSKIRTGFASVEMWSIYFEQKTIQCSTIHCGPNYPQKWSTFKLLRAIYVLHLKASPLPCEQGTLIRFAVQDQQMKHNLLTHIATTTWDRQIQHSGRRFTLINPLACQLPNVIMVYGARD